MKVFTKQKHSHRCRKQTWFLGVAGKREEG